MAVSYVLFDSSGVPLRATVTMNFTQFLTEQEKEALAKKSSPDLTHYVVFKAGDTLPSLCHQIYNDSSYYPEVAAYNQLSSVRGIRLVPNSTFHHLVNGGIVWLNLLPSLTPTSLRLP